jgi:hypothetical protein
MELCLFPRLWVESCCELEARGMPPPEMVHSTSALGLRTRIYCEFPSVNSAETAVK